MRLKYLSWQQPHPMKSHLNYDAGARYVIQTEFLAARGFREILDGEMGKSDKDAFRDLGQTHREETKKLQEGLGEIFAKA